MITDEGCSINKKWVIYCPNIGSEDVRMIGTFSIYLGSFLLLIISVYLGVVYRTTVIGDISIGFLCSTIAHLFLILCRDMKNIHKNQLSYKAYFNMIFFPKRKIRVSMAALFRIIIEDKYLLITNIKHRVIAPVGGVYKFFEPAKVFIQDELKAKEERMALPNVDPKKYENDLRLIFPIGKLLKFLQWFDSGKGREWSPIREFYEELIDSGLIEKSSIFYKIKFSKYNTIRDFTKSDSDKEGYHYSLHHYDIFDVYLTDEQKNTLKQVVESTLKRFRSIKAFEVPDGLFLATKDEIEKGQLSIGQKLGDNVRFIL